MILCFPNLDTLRLALTTGAVPAPVSATPAAAGFDDQGRPWIRPAAALPRAARAELRRLGVMTAKSSPLSLDQEVSCWFQLFALERGEGPPAVLEKTAVLFDLPAEHMAGLVSEILRLGNDRQAFRFLENGTDGRVLLRVTGPPYYSLLRALDRDGQAAAPLAYVECAPRVWVQLGYRHPLGARLKVPDGRLLLLRPPRQWTYLEDGPFRDVYDALEFQLPHGKTDWREGKLPGRLTVPLRLVPGSGTDAAELWVLHDRPFEQLDALVHGADDQLLDRLSFAVGDRDDTQVIVLRVRPSRQPPPVLVLEATAFRSHLRLPNLFLPCGTLLRPPLRRDVVRKLLADDPATITWLYPHGDGRFTPETLPDAAFRPLKEWIDHILEHDHKELALWVQAAQFDFESFVCKDDQPAPPAEAAFGAPAQRPEPSGSGPRPRADCGGGAGPKARPAAPRRGRGSGRLHRRRAKGAECTPEAAARASGSLWDPARSARQRRTASALAGDGPAERGPGEL